MVSERGGTSEAIDAPNWLVALGVGLDRFGSVTAIDRLACEVLINGTVLARDARTGQGYVVRPLKEEATDRLEGLGASDEEGWLPEIEEESEIVSGDCDDEESVWELGDSSDDSDSVDGAPCVEERVTEALALPLRTRKILAGMADIASSVGVGQACEMALRTLLGVVSVESGSVLLREASGSLRFAVVTGPNKERLTGSVIPGGAGVAAFVIERGTGVIMRHAESDPRLYQEVDRELGHATRSILCVPVLGPDQPLGCIQLINPTMDRRFESEDLQQAQEVAEALAQRLLRKHLD